MSSLYSLNFIKRVIFQLVLQFKALTWQTGNTKHTSLFPFIFHGISTYLTEIVNWFVWLINCKESTQKNNYITNQTFILLFIQYIFFFLRHLTLLQVKYSKSTFRWDTAGVWPLCSHGYPGVRCCWRGEAALRLQALEPLYLQARPTNIYNTAFNHRGFCCFSISTIKETKWHHILWHA